MARRQLVAAGKFVEDRRRHAPAARADLEDLAAPAVNVREYLALARSTAAAVALAPAERAALTGSAIGERLRERRLEQLAALRP